MIERETEFVSDEEENMYNRFYNLVSLITYRPNFRLLFERDKKDPQGRFYVQVECQRPDVHTGEMGIGRGGKGYVSEHMTNSEFIRKCFQLFRAYEEHEVREWFKFDGRSVFGPHIDVFALHSIANFTDERNET